MPPRPMSADSHLDLVCLPPDTFVSRMDPSWGDRISRVVERDGARVWVAGETVLSPWVASGQARPSDPELRRADQARDDCPHRDGTWPFSQKAIEEQCHGIDESVARKMLWENVRRLYRIE
jgi:hypothetical protein